MTPKNEVEHGVCSYCGADRSGPSAEAHEPNCLYAEPEPQGSDNSAGPGVPLGYVQVAENESNPSCHVCGAILTPTKWKCKSCGAATEPTQPQPSVELKERARELAREIVHAFVPPDGPVDRAERICDIAAKISAFASSIQEADRQEREEIMQALGISYDAELAAEQGDAYELAAEPEPLYFDTLPKAVANFSVLMEREFSKLEQQLAEARAQVSTAEIHNRFCGENGEPCQACKLKAERAAQTPPASQDGTASKEKS